MNKISVKKRKVNRITEKNSFHYGKKEPLSNLIQIGVIFTQELSVTLKAVLPMDFHTYKQ